MVLLIFVKFGLKRITFGDDRNEGLPGFLELGLKRVNEYFSKSNTGRHTSVSVFARSKDWILESSCSVLVFKLCLVN